MLTGRDTTDSSRFWSAEKYEVGRGQDSYDKQYLRGRPMSIKYCLISLTVCADWLEKNGLKGRENVEMPDDVSVNTIDQYKEAYRSIVGKGWDASCS